MDGEGGAVAQGERGGWAGPTAGWVGVTSVAASGVHTGTKSGFSRLSVVKYVNAKILRGAAINTLYLGSCVFKKDTLKTRTLQP